MTVIEAESMALTLAAVVGELSAIVEWCVAHEGECLGDNLKQLLCAKAALAEVRARLLEGGS